MNRPFKFRHVNEIVGAFTIVAMLMLIAAIYFAGRAQGWFEGSFRVNIVFDTPEGAFGLQEGAEVQVQNTPAGRVGMIYPNDEGFMQTTVSIKNRFKPFITEDSVAKVKLRFAVAGDAFIDISPGSGPVISDDGVIKGVKDEEILDRITNTIGEIEAIALPMLAEVQTMLEHVNTILAGVTASEGVAGAMIFDPEVKTNITATIAHAERIARQSADLMTNEVRRAVADLEAIQAEAALAIRESRRLIEGLQRHWLLRRYVPFDDTSRLAVDRRGAEAVDSRVLMDTRTRLSEARRAADHVAVGQAAYELGVLELLREDPGRALDLLVEAKLAMKQAGETPVGPMLLEARILLDQDRHDEADALLERLDGLSRRQRSHAEVAQTNLLRARLRMAQNDVSGMQAALSAARRPVRRADLPVLSAAYEDMHATRLEQKGDWQGVAEARSRQIAQLRDAGLFRDLAHVFERKGHAQNEHGDVERAGYSWLSAAASYAEQGAAADSQRCIQLARTAAQRSENPLLQDAVERLTLP